MLYTKHIYTVQSIYSLLKETPQSPHTVIFEHASSLEWIDLAVCHKVEHTLTMIRTEELPTRARRQWRLLYNKIPDGVWELPASQACTCA